MGGGLVNNHKGSFSYCSRQVADEDLFSRPRMGDIRPSRGNDRGLSRAALYGKTLDRGECLRYTREGGRKRCGGGVRLLAGGKGEASHINRENNRPRDGETAKRIEGDTKGGTMGLTSPGGSQQWESFRHERKAVTKLTRRKRKRD